MKKYLSIIAVVAICLILGGCGTKVIPKGEKLAVDGLAKYEITVTGGAEKVDMPELFTLEESTVPVVRVPVKFKNNSDKEIIEGALISYGIQLIDKKGNTLYESTNLLSSMDDTISSTEANAEVEGAFYFAVEDDYAAFDNIAYLEVTAPLEVSGGSVKTEIYRMELK